MSEDRRGQARANGGSCFALGHRFAASVLAAVLAVGLAASVASAQETCHDSAAFLRSPSGSVARFTVEIADDEAERALGLMNRATMAQSRAMLFVYAGPKRVAFWMKDTLIPLDMLFIDARGVVLVVHPMAEPLNKTAIDGGEGVQFVLEINGGLAGQLGLGPGTVLRHPAVDPSLAIWPCTAN